MTYLTKVTFEKPEGGSKAIPTNEMVKLQKLYSLKFLKQSGMINRVVPMSLKRYCYLKL